MTSGTFESPFPVEDREALAAQEQAYVTAVEDAVFGYGRLQPLLEMPDAENIEIHGWNSVIVQFGNGRREPMPPVADNVLKSAFLPFSPGTSTWVWCTWASKRRTACSGVM